METIPIQSSASETNFAQIAQQRNELRQAVRELGSDRNNPDSVEGSIFVKHYQKELEALNMKAKAFKVADVGGLAKAKEMLHRQKEELLKQNSGLDLDVILTETPVIKEILETMENIADLKDFRMKRILEILNPDISLVTKKRNESVLKTIKNEIFDNKIKLTETDPMVYRQAELVSYKENLGQTGHICLTPSVERDLEAIGDRMLTGKPMFLHGPTGTGKTSLARFAANHFTGKTPEMVFCNPQTRESNVWGKTGIRPAKEGAIETVEIYGPLAKAMTEGKVVIFDEFTALPKEQMVFIKGVFNVKVGDQINIVGNGLIKIMPGFQMIFTANLKSEKNPERQDLPPEIAREFEQNNLKVKYTPPSEAYDIMLARLLNRDGSIDMSDYDLLETLPNLCKAMAEIQESYTDTTDKELAKKVGAMDAGGKVHSLKKFVMTQGSVEAILSSWLVEKQTQKTERSFSEFLDERFKTALTFEEYSKDDRILVAKILAAKGFLLTVSAKELGLPQEIFDLNTIKAMRGEEALEELQEKSGKVKHQTLKDIAQLDPFDKRAKAMTTEAEALLGDTETPADKFLANIKKRVGKMFGKKTPEADTTTLEPFLKQTFEMWGVDKTKLGQLKQEVELIDPSDLDLQTLKVDTDPTKFGQYTLNPECIGLDYEKVKITTLDITTQDWYKKLPTKDLASIGEYLIKHYSDKYIIPDLSFYQWMIEKGDKAPQDLKDGNYHFSFGSILRDSDGLANVPSADWFGSKFNRNAFRLILDWDANCRVVLLERV